MNSKDKTSKFTALIETAISEAEKEISVAQEVKNDRLVEFCRKQIQYLKQIKEMAISGKLPCIKNSGIGILRGVSDWDVSDNFFNACAEVEKYYQNKYNA